MIAVDTNILVYAHRQDSPFHRQAVHALVGLAEGRTNWSIPWPCVHETLAIITHPKIYAPPSPMTVAIEALAVWMASPSCRLIGEEAGYFDTLSELLNAGSIAGGKVHDARIAAICINNGITELWSADRDFSRFPRLQTRNPLVGS